MSAVPRLRLSHRGGAGAALRHGPTPPGATAEEIAQVEAYYQACNQAFEEGALSPTGRVSTTGELRPAASRTAAEERLAGMERGEPYVGHVGHALDTGGVLQRDQFAGALADLGLALDPLTQNRYALAGGNPISYVEWDGHIPLTQQQLIDVNTAPPAGPDPGHPTADQHQPAPPTGGSGGSGGSASSSGLATAPPTVAPPRILPPPPGRVPPIARGRGGLGVLGLLLGLLSLSGDTPQHQKLDVDPEERKEGCLSQPAERPSWTQYWKLDSKGRAQGAEACLGLDVETRSGLWPDADTRSELNPGIRRPTPRGYRSGVHHRGAPHCR